MANKEISIGSIVILKSEEMKSSHLYMTVIALENGWATCQWYDHASGSYLEKEFLVQTLTIIS